MRPVRLEIQGFSAFRDHTVVDFTDVELAALVGATGSGKSSLIDAMTFALYGSVARYDERAVAPVVNQLSTEARVRFDFEVAGVGYSATRVVRRTKTGATTKEARLERGAEVLAGDPRALDQCVTALLGLDLARFNKTVVLPQGRFADFLHDKPAARDDLLRELLGLGVYQRIATAARDRAAQLKNRADVLDQTDPVDPASVSDERLAELRTRADGVAAARDALATADEELTQLAGQAAEARAELERVDAALTLLDGVTAPAGIDALQARLDAATAAADAARATVAAGREARRTAALAVAAGPDAAALQLLLRDHETAAALQRELADAQQRHAAARTAAEATAARAEAARAALAAADAAVTGARRAADEAEAARRALPERAAVEALVTAHGRAGELAATVADAAAALAATEAAEQVADTQRRAAHAALAEAERLAPAAALAAGLSLGEPCPVCYQVVHALPLTTASDAGIAPKRAAADQADTAHRAATAASAAARARWEQHSAAHQAAERAVAAAASLHELAAQLATIGERTAELEAARRAVATAERALTERKADPDATAALADDAAAQAALTGAATTLADLQARARAAADTVAGHVDAATAAAELTRARALAEALATATAAEQAAEHDASAAADTLTAATVEEQAARKAYDARRDALAALGPPAPGPTLAACWTELVGWAGTEVASRRGTRAATAADVEAITAQGRAVRDAAGALAAAFVDTRTGNVARWREELAGVATSVERDIEQLLADRARREQRAAEVAALRRQEAVAAELGRLLRVDGFQRWLLEEAVADLVARATVRLRELTSGQYSLTARRGTFEVVDHRNADEVRDARSLSGGETFLTSLALALALADSSQDLAVEGAAPLESIFLDEGFGTLDPDTLDVVAASIEELGARGRMVTIVTHIRELAERMPTRFEVTKGPASSRVERIDG